MGSSGKSFWKISSKVHYVLAIMVWDTGQTESVKGVSERFHYAFSYYVGFIPPYLLTHACMFSELLIFVKIITS